MEIEELKRAAYVQIRAKTAYENQAKGWLHSRPKMKPKDFWPKLAKLCKEIEHNIKNYPGRDPVKFGVEEFMRKSHTGEHDIPFMELPAFIMRYEECDAKLSPMFDDVDLGRGDDGFSDLMDSLPLAGPDVYEAALAGKYQDAKSLEEAVTVATPRLAKLILEGENYVVTTLEDCFVERLQYVAQQELGGDNDDEE